MANPLPFYFSYGSLTWLYFNVGFDLGLSAGGYFALVYLIPRISHYVRPYWNAGANKGKGAWLPTGGNMKTWSGIWHLSVWNVLQFVRVNALVIGVFGLLSYLVFSTGWRNPLAEVSWYGINAPGWLFDLVFARANNQPNGAHLTSYLTMTIFAVLIWYKTVPKPAKEHPFFEAIGDPFQGIAALVFLGGIHEIIWIPFYYAAYWQYLSWSIWTEVFRDVVTLVMMGLFILTFAKYKNRVIPLKIFKGPVLIYVTYLVAWWCIPYILGYRPFPITTLNNTNFGQGIYLETPWFGWWWVNAFEVFGWLLLFGTFALAVLRYRGPPK